MNNTDYQNALEKFLEKNGISFWNIYRFNVAQTKKLNPDYIDIARLNSGRTVITDQEHLLKYLCAYGGLHYHKLKPLYRKLFKMLDEDSEIEIIDYGCGQAIASSILLSCLKKWKVKVIVKTIALIDLSTIAISRGQIHLDQFIGDNSTNVITQISSFDSIDLTSLSIERETIKIHLFSNVLDMFDHKTVNILHENISKSFSGKNYFICVSPNFFDAVRMINSFSNCFGNSIDLFGGGAGGRGKKFNIGNKRWEKNQPISQYHNVFCVHL